MSQAIPQTPAAPKAPPRKLTRVLLAIVIVLFTAIGVAYFRDRASQPPREVHDVVVSILTDWGHGKSINGISFSDSEKWGNFQELAFLTGKEETTYEGKKYDVEGLAKFSRSDKRFHLKLVQRGGTWIVSSVDSWE